LFLTVTLVGIGCSGNAGLTGDGTVVFSGVNTYSGTTTINGATLQINGGNALGRSSALTLNNGTLRYAASSANGSLDISTGRGITFAAGGATINTGGNSVTLSNSIGGGGSGSLTYNDTAATAGRLTLGGANSYSGGTTITRGTLLANNSSGSATGSGAVIVGAGATLGGTGTIAGTVSLSSGTGAGTGGNLAPGASVGTLTVGGLTASTDSAFTYEFANTSTYDTTIVSGLNGLNFDGTSNGEFHLYATGGITPWSTPGTYNVIQFSGTNQGNALDSTWTTASGNNSHIFSDSRVAGLTYQFAFSGSFLQLIIGGTPPASWNFNSDGNWGDGTKWSGGTAPNGVNLVATFGTGTTVTVNAPTINVTVEAPKTVGSMNFSNSTTSYNITGSSAVTLNNSGSGNATILDGTGNHSISAPLSLASDTDITVANAANTLTISGAISGSVAINKKGDGTLALNGSNTGYTGTTSLVKGILQLGNANALGSGGLNVTDNSTVKAGANVTINNPVTITAAKTATVDTSANTLTLGGLITENGGSANVTVSGTGTLILTADSTYSGTTTINAGSTLQFGNGGTTGSAPSSAITDNGLLGFNRSDSLLTLLQPISGTGALNQAGTGTTHLQVNNTYSGATTIGAGTLSIESSLALQNSTLTYNTGDGTLAFGVATATIGALAGTKNLALTGSLGDVALTVGGNGATTMYSGVLSDGTGTGSLIKAGAGTLTLTAAERYGATSTGITTNVTGGILALSATGSLSGGGVQTTTGAGGIQNNGGAITVNNSVASSIQGGSGGYTQTAGTATFADITFGNNNDQGRVLAISGGSFTAGTLTGNRSNLNFSAEPAAGSTTDGVYISGTATVHFTGTVNIGGTASGENSSVSMRTDGGNTTVDGIVTVQLNNQGRWSALDVNGGSLTVNDATSGVELGGTTLGQSIFLMRAGTATVGKITFGTADIANNGVLNVTGGTLYIGSGGMARGNPGGTNYNAIVRLGTGTIGATADWSAAADLNANNAATLAAGGNVNGGVTVNGLLLNGDATTGITFQAADATNTPHNITIGPNLLGSGALTKTGGGTLTLNGNNSYTGATNVLAGTLQLGANELNTGSSNLTMGGGTLGTGGFSATMGSLNVRRASTIDLGAGNNGDTLKFTVDSGALHWGAGSGTPASGATLHIANWAGSPSGGGTDQIQFPSTATLTPNQLNQVVFDGSGFSHSALITVGDHKELVPSNAALTTLALGDVDHSGVTNASDIGAMMNALRDVPAYTAGLPAFTGWTPAQATVALADTSLDNTVNNLDLQALVVYLANGGTGFNAPGGGSLTAVPEPASIVLAGLALPALVYPLRRRIVGGQSGPGTR
jgi:autotransporter-associated beta strand protein